MSDDDSHSKPRPIPHVRLYVLAGALCVASGAFLVIAFAWPDVPAMPNMAAAAAVLATLVIIGTASMKRYEIYDAARRDETARILAAMEKHHAEQLRAMGRLAYDFRRVVAFAEQGIGISHDVSEAIEGVDKRLDGVQKALREEFEERLAATVIEAIRAASRMNGATVVPIQGRHNIDR